MATASEDTSRGRELGDHPHAQAGRKIEDDERRAPLNAGVARTLDKSGTGRPGSATGRCVAAPLARAVDVSASATLLRIRTDTRRQERTR
jgi:hypothetical protein